MVNLTNQTKPVREKEIKREWHLFDAGNHVLGRLVTSIASLLIGKNKANYVDYLDGGDNIVVINAKNIKVSGKKEKLKTYSRYSGYPGGLKKINFREMKETKPGEIIRHAVYGMLPKNKLRDVRMTRLHIFAQGEHPFKDKFEKHGKKNS